MGNTGIGRYEKKERSHKANRLNLKERNKLLQELGFQSYKDYLKSALWRDIRKRVYKQKKSRCCCCDRQSQQIHHEFYTRGNITGDNVKYLWPICKTHHREVHYGKNFLSSKVSSAKLQFMIEEKRLNRRNEKKIVVDHEEYCDEEIAEIDLQFETTLRFSA